MDLVLELVRDRAIERPEPPFPLSHSGADAAQVLRHRRLLDQRDRPVEAVRAHKQLTARAGLLEVLDDPRQEGEQDAAEDLVLLLDLVAVETLRVAQVAELHRLRDDWNVADDLVRRVLEVVGDPEHQHRHVVEEVIGGKDPVLIDRHTGSDSIEPAHRQLIAREPDSFGENAREGALGADVHGHKLRPTSPLGERCQGTPDSMTITFAVAWTGYDSITGPVNHALTRIPV